MGEFKSVNTRIFFRDKHVPIHLKRGTNGLKTEATTKKYRTTKNSSMSHGEGYAGCKLEKQYSSHRHTSKDQIV